MFGRRRQSCVFTLFDFLIFADLFARDAVFERHAEIYVFGVFFFAGKYRIKRDVADDDVTLDGLCVLAFGKAPTFKRIRVRFVVLFRRRCFGKTTRLPNAASAESYSSPSLINVTL